MTHAEAQNAIARIAAAADAAKTGVAIAIADEHGDLMAAYRTDGARPRFMHVSIRKAHTCAVLGRDTDGFHEDVIRGQQQQIAYYGDPLLTGLRGGIPILAADGTVLGGIGVTGMGPAHDLDLAAHGLPCFAGAVH
jgi:glc operon protein GlcG